MGSLELAEQHKHVAEAKKEFAAEIAAHLEVAGAHQQQLKAIYLKHKHVGENATDANQTSGSLADPIS